MQNSAIDSLLKKAKDKEKKYEWLQAAEFYSQVVTLVEENEDSVKAAICCEQLGYSLFRAALQAETNDQFQSRMLQAANANEKASMLNQKSTNKIGSAKTFGCQAKAIYARSWIETNPARKRDLLHQWWNLNYKAMEIFESADDQIAVAQTCNDMIEGSMDCRYWTAPNWEESSRIRKELISLGEKALTILSSKNNWHELARTYCWLSCLCAQHNVSIFIQTEEMVQKALAYSRKAMQLSKKTQDAWLIGWSHMAAFYISWTKNEPFQRYIRQWIKYGKIARDNYLTGVATIHLVNGSRFIILLNEDPAKNRQISKRSLRLVPKAICHLEIISMVVWNAYFVSSSAFISAASIELDIKTKKAYLKKAIEYAKKSIEVLEGWHQSNIPMMIQNLSQALYQLSEIENDPGEKKHLVGALFATAIRSTRILEDYPNNSFYQIFNNIWIILAKAEIAKISKIEKKIELLKDAVSSIDTCLKEIREFVTKETRLESHLRIFGNQCHKFGEIFSQLYSLTKERSLLFAAIDVYDFALTLFDRVGLCSEKAASFWQRAKIKVQLGNHLEAAGDYELAAGEYSKAIKKTPNLREFYEHHSLYMLAWSHIEKARYNHNLENYSQSMTLYKQAASLIEKTDSWSYLSSNYYAWEQLEKGEDFSRKEEPSQAISSFKLAIESFKRAENSIETKIDFLVSTEEKNQALNLIEASDLRLSYCQARIGLEEAKILDRKGDYNLSSSNYRSASQEFRKIAGEVDSEAERRELQLMEILCLAWESMALAEGKKSPDLFLVAADLFEEAKKLCLHERTSLWALGNSSFCKGLAAGIRYQSSLDLSEHSLAKGHMKTAANNYLQAGFLSASEYAKATQRLFDAYAFMNQAENELDQEKRAKQYQMVENLLEIAAVSFVKAKQPEKTSQVKQILENVREEKALAASLNEVMHAPTIMSSTMTFAAPSSTSEVSVGLEQFQHANVQANLIAGLKDVKVGESFCLTVEFVNAGKEPALLTRVEDFVPPNFTVVKKPEIYRLEESCLNMKGKQISPLNLVEAKMVLQPSKEGVYQLKPIVHYLDELGQSRSLQLKPVEIRVEEIVLANRVSTGTRELDSLLFGGIPEEYAVVLAGSPCDERDFLVGNFLEAGTREGQTSFYATNEAIGLESLLKKTGFYLFLCNPKPKVEVPNLPNVYRLHGKTDLTSLNISLLKAYRSVEPSSQKRVCLDIVSDVLLRHGAEVTRRWLSELITDLESKGFTVLIVLDPSMHPPDQANAILNLFDGEISLYQTDDPLECKKSLRVKKLRNQDHIKNPICLTKSVT